jgi:protein-disulfide isomerase
MSEKHTKEESFTKEILEDIKDEAHEAGTKTRKVLKSGSSWLSKNKLVAAVLGGAILLSGALVFLAVSLGGNNGGGGSFAEQIAEYERSQQNKQQLQQEDQMRLAEKQAKNVKPISKEDHVLGEKKAKISIFEYSDFECPFCKSFAPTSKQAVEMFNGDVNLVFRHFPLEFHEPHATDAALASECAADLGGNDAFWKFHDVYFEKTTSNKGIEKSAVYAIAQDIGVSESKFKSCIDSQKFIEKVRGDMAEGAQSGVTGTPGNILRNNDTKDVIFLPGAYPIESFEAAIKELLSK